MINLSDIARIGGVPWTTLKRYMSLLEAIYFVQLVQPWFSNYEKRLVKRPKIYFTDTGILCHLYGVNQESLLNKHIYLGQIMENFVFQELVKLTSWHHEIIKIYTFRDTRDMEVDFILEKQDGSIVGIEVKSSATVYGKDFMVLRMLADTLGNKFHAGYILYTGDKRVSFGDKLAALPIGALWN